MSRAMSHLPGKNILHARRGDCTFWAGHFSTGGDMGRQTNSTRRRFIRDGAALTAAATGYWVSTAGAQNQGKAARRIKVGVIGCGSVSTKYFPHLAASPFVEL